MKTHLPSFIVAEIPEPIRGEIQEIRESLLIIPASFPVEITLAGSSGVGPIPAGTEIATIVDQAEAICSSNAPFEASFSQIVSFPGTSIFYLSPLDKTPFERFHNCLRSSSIGFSDSPFPYTPHCTLRAGGVLSPDEAVRIARHRFPRETFTIDTISLYDLDNPTHTCNLLYRWKLKR